MMVSRAGEARPPALPSWAAAHQPNSRLRRVASAAASPRRPKCENSDPRNHLGFCLVRVRQHYSDSRELGSRCAFWQEGRVSCGSSRKPAATALDIQQVLYRHNHHRLVLTQPPIDPSSSTLFAATSEGSPSTTSIAFQLQIGRAHV